MKEFIEYLLNQIVSQPEQIKVEESDEGGLKVYKIHVAVEDMGTVIGKEGHTIKSLRDLVRAKAIKDNVRVRIIVEESQEMPSLQND